MVLIYDHNLLSILLIMFPLAYFDYISEAVFVKLSMKTCGMKIFVYDVKIKKNPCIKKILPTFQLQE